MTGLLVPFRGSHPLTQPFGAVPLGLEPPMWVDYEGAKPWRARAEPFGDAARAAHVHPGIDYGMAQGTKLYAPAAGRIARGTDPRGGRWILGKIPGRNTWWYLGHLEGWLVPVGALVDAGELVAVSGATGLVTAAHVHFDVRHANVSPRMFYNPRRLLVGGDRAGVEWIVPQ